MSLVRFVDVSIDTPKVGDNRGERTEMSFESIAVVMWMIYPADAPEEAG